MDALDVIIRMHDPARLDELDRAVFSAALSEHRPLTVMVVCQRFTRAELDAVDAMLAQIRAIVPDVGLTVLNRPDPEPRDARSALLNLGLAAATGRFLAFLDYDDVIYPEAYGLLIQELRDTGAAIAFGGVLNAEVSRAGLLPFTLSKRRIFHGSGLAQLLHDNFCPLHSFVVDRHRIRPDTLRIDEALTGQEDYDLLLRICARHPASFRRKDVIVGEYLFKDDGSNINPLAGPGSAGPGWLAISAAMDARKAALTMAPEVLAGLGITEPGLTVAEALDHLRGNPPDPSGVKESMPASSPSLSPPDAALLDLLRLVSATGYRFVTGTPATHARVNARPGNAEARSLIDVFGWSRPFATDLLSPEILAALRSAGMLAEAEGRCRSLVRISTMHEVNVLHSAYPTVAADSVFFGPDTYRFADAVAAELGTRTTLVRRAVDIGCGAGPGGIVVARARPDAEVFMADINPAALRLAQVNAVFAGATRACAVQSDLLSAIPGTFDLIVSNPPYLVDPAERAYRHGGGPLGADLSLAILDAALARLAPGGTLLLYTGAAVVNGEDPFKIAAAQRLVAPDIRWTYREADPDVFGEELEAQAYQGADRIAAIVLTVTRKEEQNA